MDPAAVVISAPVRAGEPGSARSRRRWLWRALEELRARLARPSFRYVVVLYLGSRALLLFVALVDGAIQHRSVAYELTNWDGIWYLRVATRWYPHGQPDFQSTLGFLPLYPLVFVGLSELLRLPLTLSGLLVSGIGGLVTTWNVYRLSLSWWDERTARRVALAFVAFPGSVVFSMLYSEGLLLALGTAALLALERRRLVLAGVLAGLAAVTAADAAVLVLSVGLVGVLEVTDRPTLRNSARALAGVGCALAGLGGFGLFLFSWVGSPLASLRAQRAHWGERINLLALVHQTNRIIYELSMPDLTYHKVNLNLVVGEIGIPFLVGGLYLCWRHRKEISGAALVFTLGISFLMVTTEFVPPNPRLLLTAFPVVAVYARSLSRRGFRVFVAVSGALLVVLSGITYVGIALRP